jgi:hypothetical protein
MYPESYKKEPTKKTPRVILDSGVILIMGRSIPENPGEFYRPVYDWICKCMNASEIKTTLSLGFEYINTTSTKWIYSILKEVSERKKLAENVRLNWYYEHGDEDMCELGLILRSLVDCPFLVVEVEEINSSRIEKFLSSGF